MIQMHRPARNVPNIPSVPVARGTIYTCLMHPQIRRDVLGNCPTCGMTLEPDDISEAEGTSRELKDMTRRFVFGAILATPIFVLEMGGHLSQLRSARGWLRNGGNEFGRGDPCVWRLDDLGTGTGVGTRRTEWSSR
jgi:Heavy metal binding domain